MQIFDIMACGGFVLADYSRELDEIFEIGREVETYRTIDELELVRDASADALVRDAVTL